jgi:tetratricopeptide (TPR) repeat protein
MIDKDYSNALKLYWSGRPSTSLEHLSKVLADDPMHNARLELYRLWIEILTNECETDGLNELYDHLCQLSLVFPECAEDFHGLRGIVQFELGRIGMAKLYLITSRGSIYNEELSIALNRRFDKNKAKDCSDYFCLRNMAHLAMFREDLSVFSSIDKVLRKRFTDTPYEVEMIAFSSKDNPTKLEQILLNAIQLFPMQSKYLCQLAALKYEQGAYQTCVRYLERALEMEGGNDFEILNMLAKSCEVVYTHTGDEKMLSRHKYYQSIMLQASSFANERDNTMPKVWWKKLKSDEFMNLKRSFDDEITIPFSANVRKGDMIFLAHKDYQSQLRLIAIYEAAHDAELDAIHMWMVKAKKIIIAEKSVQIPFDRSFDTREPVELGESGLVILEKAIYDFDDDSIRNVFERIAG